MRVLVATNRGQGRRSGDYCHTICGELVYPPLVECTDPERCGCGRGFCGLASSRATTTALIAERPGLTDEELAEVVTDGLDRQGWLQLAPSDSHGPAEIVADVLADLERITAAFALDAIVEREGFVVRLRSGVSGQHPGRGHGVSP